jgi:hypothetical protein
VTTTDLLLRSTRTLFALAALLVLGSVPASADGPLSLVTTVPVGSVTHDVDRQGSFLYVAAEAGLTVLDISSGTPVVRGSLTTSTPNMGVKVRGQYAFLAGMAGGFRVVDISDPDAPVVVATRPAHYAFDVALKDDVAFIASFAGELYSFDIANPLNPVQIGVLGLPAWKTPGPDANCLAILNSYATNGNAKVTGVVVKEGVLIATDWAYGRIYYYDVTDPASPEFRGTHYAPYVQDVAIDLERDIVYMLSTYSYGSGIYTVPLSSLRPDVSTAHASCAACGYLASTVPIVGLDQGGIALGAGGAYLIYGGGRNNGEFHVVDVRHPLAMAYAATVPIGPHGATLSTMMGAHIDGDRAYFAAGALGIQVYDFPGLSDEIITPPPDAPPAIVNFSLNAGAASTTSRVVTLDNHVNGGAPVEYRASQSSDLSGAAWLPYATAPSFSLTGPNGPKQVYFQVRNVAAIESAVASDTITLNEPAPVVTMYRINNGANSTATRTVTLNNTVSNNPTEYRASESSTFAGAVWQPYASAPSFELSVGNATKRVYFQTRNSAGPSAAVSDTIVLSEPTPVISRFAINDGVSSTATRTVTLNNTASGAPTEYRASESSTFAGAVWLPYAPAPTFELSAGVATKRVYFQLRNAAGAISTVASDTIGLTQ